MIRFVVSRAAALTRGASFLGNAGAGLAPVWHVLSLVIVLSVIATIYYRGLDGPFVFDDRTNIIENPAIAITAIDPAALRDAAASSLSGPLRRPLASATFAINYYLAGGFDSALPFKLTNLLIHLINVCLLYWLTALIQTSRKFSATDETLGPGATWVPMATAAMWGLHPILTGTTLYVVQRMTMLSMTFVILGLILLLVGRQRLLTHKRGATWIMVAGWSIGMTLGLGAKENAILLPLLALAMEASILPRPTSTSAKRSLTGFYGIALFLPLFLGLIWIISHPEIIADSYTDREFTLVQRLLTEPRILWIYLSLILLPIPSRFTLFRDDIAPSLNALTPWTTLPSMIGMLAVAAFGVLARNRYPFLSFAILWFLAGHALEAGPIGLDLAHDHRNYLPSFGPILATVIGLAILDARFGRFHVGIILLGALIVGLLISSAARTYVWADEERLIRDMVTTHPASAASNGMAAELLLTRHGKVEEAMMYYSRSISLAPHETGYRVHLAMAAARLKPEPDVRTGRAISIRVRSADDQSIELPVRFEAVRWRETIWLLPSSSDTESIAARFSSSRITRFSRMSLTRLARCVTESKQLCAGLYPVAVRWHHAALLNPTITPDMRMDVVIGLFNMARSVGNYAEARNAARLGRQFAPENPTFMLMEAETNIALAQFESADAILAEIYRTTSDREMLDLARSLGTSLARARAHKK